MNAASHLQVGLSCLELISQSLVNLGNTCMLLCWSRQMRATAATKSKQSNQNGSKWRKASWQTKGIWHLKWSKCTSSVKEQMRGKKNISHSRMQRVSCSGVSSSASFPDWLNRFEKKKRKSPLREYFNITQYVVMMHGAVLIAITSIWISKYVSLSPWHKNLFWKTHFSRIMSR